MKRHRGERLIPRKFVAFMLGEYGAPSWPKRAHPSRRQALPRVITWKQAKSINRLASKGGRDYLNPQRRLGRVA